MGFKDTDLAKIAKKSFGVPSPTSISFTDIDGERRTIILDCTSSIKTSVTNKVTMFPVELSGNSISDHSISNPLKLTIQAMVSESPTKPLINLFNAASGLILSNAAQPNTGLSNGYVQNAIKAGISLGFGALLDTGNTKYEAYNGEATVMSILQDRKNYDFTYPKRAMLALKQIADKSMPLTIRTFFNDSLYENMMIQNLDFDQSGQDGDSLVFSMALVQVTTVTTETKSGKKKSEANSKDPNNSGVPDEKTKGQRNKKVVPTRDPGFD